MKGTHVGFQGLGTHGAAAREDGPESGQWRSIRELLMDGSVPADGRQREAAKWSHLVEGIVMVPSSRAGGCRSSRIRWPKGVRRGCDSRLLCGDEKNKKPRGVQSGAMEVCAYLRTRTSNLPIARR